MPIHERSTVVRHRFLFLLLAPLLLLAACRTAAPAVSPVPTSEVNPTTIFASVPNPTTMALPTALSPVIEVLPTITPEPGNDHISVADLPLDEAGSYSNIVYGYQLRYPADWYTGFGNRPLLVSFSNLDPGNHNRASMRADGCLIEVRLSTNVFGMSLDEVRAQMPRVFADAETLTLDGEPAFLVRESNEQAPFDSEWVLVEHTNRWFRVSFDYARNAASTCLPAWEELLNSWQWFDPDFVVYRNRDYGYAISHPRHWYRFNAQPQGISLASEDPTDMQDRASFALSAMLVDTNVFENEQHLSLKEWVAVEAGELDLANDIPIEGLVGVRVLRAGPLQGVQEMSGYFQGPLGRIYVVTCLYPEGQQWEFRPVANAIIYSFSF
jgi:hypothetical protein